MNLDSITTKGWILALFIRDDGERFLLGDGWYDFKDSLQHFQPNTFANDIVELQGTDGQLLAGQVRRSASQAFDGYVGDATVSKTEIENRRRDFLMFFRKKHFYKVIYIFCDGSAIQRDRGYIVDAPSVPEMWQKFPSYHVSLAFEQVNYYEYAEDEDGKEIFAHMADINVSTIMSGGLVWDEYGAVSENVGWSSPIELTGESITINDAIEDAPMTLKKIEGNATQANYMSPNIFDKSAGSTGKGLTWAGGAEYAVTNAITSTYIAISDNDKIQMNFNAQICFYNSSKTYLGALQSDNSIAKTQGIVPSSFTVPSGQNIAFVRLGFRPGDNSSTNMTTQDIMVNKGDALLPYEAYGQAPNPLNPQTIQTVTGKQTVTISDGNNTQTFDLDLVGKNIFDGILEDGLINGTSGLNMANANFTRCQGFIPVDAQTTYTFSSSGYSGTWYIYEYKADKTYNLSSNKTTSNGHFTTNAGTAFVRFRLASHDNTLAIQCEKGSTATTFESYFNYGGEKFDDYSDYIWNDNGTWKIHREIGKIVLNGTENWGVANTGTVNFYYRVPTGLNDFTSNVSTLMSNYGVGGVISNSNTDTGIVIISSGGDLRIRYGTEMSVSDWQAKVALTHMEVYYPLVTPTDTAITDATLISQLNTITQLYEGDNTITITPASGATGTLTIEYMSEQSTTQGYVWESGGTGGLTTVDVSSVDAVQPIWTIEGPATNPTLTNITSSQSLSWLGTVPNGQTLTIDIANQTATMAGANVYAFLSGDWVELRPGTNRISYAVTGTDQPSTLSWNNIVG